MFPTRRSSYYATCLLLCIMNGCLGKLFKVETSCDDYTKNIAQYSKTESITLNNREISGVWTSSICEAFHGPQFILRKYVIGDGRWSADYYHYKDGWCTEPIFTLHMKGGFKIGEKNALGGQKGEFSAKSFMLIPHNDDTLIDLIKTTEAYCPGAGLPVLRKDKQGKTLIPAGKNFSMTKDVYRYTACRRKFGIHLYTHKIIRIIRNRRSSNINDKLYFGEAPTRNTRRNFIPSAYHFPLSRPSSNCQVCKKLETATSAEEVILKEPPRSFPVEDAWTSVSCQVVTGTFMSRYLKFSQPDKQGRRFWNLIYYFYLDSSCKVLSYKISAQGTYSNPVKSNVIAGAQNVAFNLTDTEITPYEMLIVELLQAEPEGTCGVSAKWKTGITQSVKDTKGCRIFRVEIPSVEYDVLKTVRNNDGSIDLYTGQSSTDNLVPNRPERRPNSFQLPLRRCRDVVSGARGVVKPTTRAIKTRKINIQIPQFTIPRKYFMTEPHKKKETDPVDNNVEKDPRSVVRFIGNNGNNAGTRGLNIGLILACILLSSFLR